MASPPTTPSRRRASPAKSSLSRRLTLVPSDCTPSPTILFPPPSFPLASDRGRRALEEEEEEEEEDPWEHETTPPISSAYRRTRNSRSNTLTPTKTSRAPTPSKVDETLLSEPLPFNVRLPPRPSDLPDHIEGSPTASRETSPSRFSSIASPLARIATVKHARTQSSPMGFTGDAGSLSSSSPRGGAASGNALFNMFKTPDTTPEKKKGGFLSNFSFPTSGNTTPQQTRRMPPPTDIIDEFSGINFASLLAEFLEEPTGTPSSPEEALHRSPEGRLEHVVQTATELLDRVYGAYRQRTDALTDSLGELEISKENMANERLRTENLKSQLSKLAEVERLAAEEQTILAQNQTRKIAELEAELLRERRKRDAIEEEVRRSRRTKRSSAASDSGFESDGESMMSRQDSVSERRVSIVSPIEPIEESVLDDSLILHFPGHDCDACRAREVQAAASAEPKNPTPLREAWGPNGASSAGGNNSGVWGFFKGRAQQRGGQRQSWNPEWDLDSVKLENRQLKTRIREMEGAVEAALEVVAGRGGM